MTDKEISAIAQEYANETIRETKDGFRKLAVKLKAKIIKKFLQWLLYRYCLVEKEKATDLCRLTLEHSDSVDYGLIDGLTDIVCEIFHEIYHQVADNPNLRKEVES